MKLLAADIGNTNVTIGLFEDDRLARSWRAITRANATADEVADWIAQARRLPILVTYPPRDQEAAG